MYKLLGITLATIIMTGCMQTENSPTPTHRWASTSDANRAQYQNDHAKCQAQASLSGARTELDPDSEAFSQYRQCMNNNGYVLAAYND